MKRRLQAVANWAPAGDFALAAGHRRIAINLLAGTLNSTAPFSIATASSGASTVARRPENGDAQKLCANVWPAMNGQGTNSSDRDRFREGTNVALCSWRHMVALESDPSHCDCGDR
jgi:hypothetical protein